MKTLFSFLALLLACLQTAMAQDLNEMKGFKGLLNGKTAVEIVVSEKYNDGDWITAGYCYYPKAKTPAPILVVATPETDKKLLPKGENHYMLKLVEYQPDGEITGIFRIWYTEVEGDYNFQRGTWTNPTTGKVMQMSQVKQFYDVPEWYPGEPAAFTAPKREAWSFKHHFDQERDGWLTDIHVDIYAGGKKSPLSFEEPLCGAFEAPRETDLTWVTEDDINFDGIPDLKVFIGMTTRAQNMYKAFVWNPVTRQFYPVEAFEEIQEPDFDKKAKTITSYARDVDGLYIDVFKWKNGVLKKVSSKKESLP
ncbi:MAG: hypothetical protein J5720_02830 [Bacteroidaceae bacterium]|nr:hypothetical protein [Bacteroidaceae bacterium]